MIEDGGHRPTYAPRPPTDPRCVLTFRAAGPELDAARVRGTAVLQTGVVPRRRRAPVGRRGRLGRGHRAGHRELPRPGAEDAGGAARPRLTVRARRPTTLRPAGPGSRAPSGFPSRCRRRAPRSGMPSCTISTSVPPSASVRVVVIVIIPRGSSACRSRTGAAPPPGDRARAARSGRGRCRSASSTCPSRSARRT